MNEKNNRKKKERNKCNTISPNDDSDYSYKGFRYINENQYRQINTYANGKVDNV